MINVQENFKIDLRTYGRQFNIKLKVNNSDFNADNLNYIKPSFTTPLFKTIMHQIELDSKVFMSKGTKISGRIGVKVNEKNYKYIDLNNYYVQSCERQEDTNSYRVLAYSKMKEAMVDYDLSFAGKITVRNYLIKVCERLGWNTDNIPATFINSEKMIDPNLHTGIKYSFRDALDEIATITCSFLMFKGDNFYLLYLTETNETIDESYLDEDNVTIGEKYFINSLVFSRAEESDNIYRKDNTSITANGLHEYRIADCQLLSTNDRADYIDEMFNYLKTLEFYIFDVQSKGILFLEACDLFNFKLNNTTYKVALLNDEINIDDGLTENLFLDKPEETETEYKYADSTDKRIDQAYILVDKQNKKITQLTEETTENSQKITKTEQDINGLTTKVSSVEQSVENITNTQNTATGKNIHLEDSSDDPLVSIKVKGSTTQATRSGKNKLPYNYYNGNSKTVNGITFTVNKDRSITANGTSTANAQFSITNPDNYAIVAGSYKLVGENNTYTKKAIRGSYKKADGTIKYISSDSSFTIPEGATNVHLYVVILQGETVNNVTFYPMLLNLTETDLTFEAGGASPSPDYPSPIENVEGKNKFDINQEKEVFGIMLYKYSYYLKPNTKYTISSNCPASTTANIYANSNSSKSAVYINKNQTIQSDENGYFYILVRFKADASDNSTFNLYEKVLNGTYYIQLEEGTVATPYFPYNSLEIKDVGENLFDCANSKIIYNNAITLYERLTNGLKIISNGGQYNMLYFLVDTVENLKGKTLTLSSDILFSKEKQYVDFGLYYTDFNGGNRKKIVANPNITSEGKYQVTGQVEEGENRYYVCIGLRPNMDSNFAKGDYTIYDNLQVEIGETATPYKPYQEQKVDFPLSEGQKLYEGSYLASDGIHHKRKQIVLKGTENWAGYAEKTNTVSVYLIMSDLVETQNSNILSNRFQKVGYEQDIEGIVATPYVTKLITIKINKSRLTEASLVGIKNWLATQYANGTPVIVEYELSEEEIVPYTETQQEAWDKIEQLHTYKNVTNIFSDTELDIVYVRDNGLSDMYETKQNASKNYTKTSTEIQQLDDSIKRTISQIGDRSQKITTVTEDIDGIKNEVSNIQDLTQTTNGTKTIVLSNCVKGNLLKLQIKGNNTVFKYLYPSDDLYPSDNLLPMGDSRILVNGTVYELGITDVLRKNGEVYDEFILEKGQAKVIRRINTDGTVKTEEMTEDLGKLSISLNEGTNTIKILNYTAEITAKYAIKNDYTDIFATKVEMNSSIEQTAEGINLEVRKKVDENEVISKINQSAEAVTIDASKININGTVSANGNFKVNTNGNMECNNGKFNEGEIICKDNGLSAYEGKIRIEGNTFITGLYSEGLVIRKVGSSTHSISNPCIFISMYDGEPRLEFVSSTGQADFNVSPRQFYFQAEDNKVFSIHNSQMDIIDIPNIYAQNSTIHCLTLNQTSKAESKKNFEKFTLEEAKKILNNTDIYKYNLKIQDDKDKKHIGFVIGDDYNYSEEITSEKNDGANIYSMTSVLYPIVKEQQKQIEEFQQRFKKLEGGQDK